MVYGGSRIANNEGLIDQIILLTRRAKERLATDLDTDVENPTAPDHETAEQLIEENLDPWNIIFHGVRNRL